MLELRDEEMVHLLSLGGWIRGLEIGAASVAADFSPERASKLRQLDLLDYYLQRLDTLSTPLKSTPLISQIISGLKEVRQKLADNSAVSEQDVLGIQTTARNLVALIEGGPPGVADSPVSLSTHVRNYGDVFGQAAASQAFDEDLGEYVAISPNSAPSKGKALLWCSIVLVLGTTFREDFQNLSSGPSVTSVRASPLAASGH